MLTATAHQFSVLLSRTVSHRSPETRLWIAVLAQAWADAASPKESSRREARDFFMNGRATVISEKIGIDGDFLREIFLKHHPKSPTHTSESVSYDHIQNGSNVKRVA